MNSGSSKSEEGSLDASDGFVTDPREPDAEMEVILDRRSSVFRLDAFDWRDTTLFDDLADVAVNAELASGWSTLDVCLRFCAVLPAAGMLVFDCLVTCSTAKINTIADFTNVLESVSSIVDLLARVNVEEGVANVRRRSPCSTASSRSAFLHMLYKWTHPY